MTFQRGAAGYLVLVVLPIVALLGILRTGEALQAPPNLDGVWNVSWESAASNQLSAGSNIPTTLKISQSGLFLAIVASGSRQITLSGEFHEGRITAASKEMELIATTVSPNSVVGVMKPVNCPKCRDYTFQATRVS